MRLRWYNTTVYAFTSELIAEWRVPFVAEEWDLQLSQGGERLVRRLHENVSQEFGWCPLGGRVEDSHTGAVGQNLRRDLKVYGGSDGKGQRRLVSVTVSLPRFCS